MQIKNAHTWLLILGLAAIYPGSSRAQLQKLAETIQSPHPTGPSVSPADSAAAIQSFRTATGGSGQYYQYLDTYTLVNKKGKDSVFRDTMAIAISDAHFVRTNFTL